MNEFKKTRIEALNYWLKKTNRSTDHKTIDFETYENRWIDKYTSDKMHNSLFCSMLDWNSHITDMLSDSSLDKLKFEDEYDSEVLFRYYTRFLLIVSEVISDFSKVVELIAGGQQGKIRQMLNSPNLDFETNQLIGYINNICKHKIEKTSELALHNCNHHAKKVFNDSNDYKRMENTIFVGAFTKNDVRKVQIEAPKLKDIIDQIMFCYLKVNEKMESICAIDKGLLLSKFKEFERPLDEVC